MPSRFYEYKIKSMKNREISSRLIFRKVEGLLSEQEEKDFAEWLNVDRSHRVYYEQMRKLYLQEHREKPSIEEVADAWQMFEKRITDQQVLKLKRRRLWILNAAASIAILLGGYFWLLSQNYFGGEEIMGGQQIVPGHFTAVLELADGSAHQLGKQSYLLQEKTGHQIKVDSALLVYSPAEEKWDTCSKEVIYNKLMIPKGGEFQLELEDGTKVWLNAASNLRYPVAFSRDVREVYLEGEAYFEVKQEENRPFVVHFDNQKVTVLGTSFGISCYPNEKNTYTTLVSGKVKVDVVDRKLTYLLEPGMQVAYDKVEGLVTKKQVNVAEFIVWKDGKYLFVQKRLDEILTTLSRWYDFEVFYQNESAKEVLFSGELKRFDDFAYLLSLIERASDVRFVINQKTVQVMNQK